MSKLNVTFSPHIQDRTTVSCMNYYTMAALAPAVLVGLYFFGYRALFIIVLSILSAVAAEAGMEKIMGKPATTKNGLSILTGLLFAMLLPVGAPWWAVIVGAAVAVVLGRQLFGGLGGNPFNSVIVGYLVLLLSWPNAVGVYQEPAPLFAGCSPLFTLDPSELPLGILAFGDNAQIGEFYHIGMAIIGGIPGGIGTTSVLALLIGGLFLVYKKIIPWQIPLGFLGGMFVFGLLCWMADSEGSTYANPFYHIIFGYSMFGAFFLAPDSDHIALYQNGRPDIWCGSGNFNHDHPLLGSVAGRRHFRHHVFKRSDADPGSPPDKKLWSGKNVLRRNKGEIK